MATVVAVGLVTACSGSDGGGAEHDAGPSGGDDATPGVDASPPGSDAGGEPVVEAEGCDGASLLSTPADPAATGPWPVGVRTARIGRLTVEVWYPAERGSEAGAERARYDIREALPASQRGAIPDADNPLQECRCHRDLPLDAAHGPYPVVAFVHGTAAFRTQSLEQVTHWASRGFVVLAADHPGLWLADSLALACPDSATGERDVGGDVDAVLAAVADPGADLAFLSGRIDTTRMALAGHSAGGSTVAGLADREGVRAVLPLASGQAIAAGDAPVASLFMGGTDDAVVDYAQSVSAYEGSPDPRFLVGLEGAGHLAFSDLCAIQNDEGQNILEVAQEHGICGAAFAGFLFDCNPAYLDPAEGWRVVNHATTAVLEETLHCGPSAAERIAALEGDPAVAEIRSSP